MHKVINRVIRLLYRGRAAVRDGKRRHTVRGVLRLRRI